MTINLPSGPFASFVLFAGITVIYGNVGVALQIPGALGLLLIAVSGLSLPLLYLRLRGSFQLPPILLALTIYHALLTAWAFRSTDPLAAVIAVRDSIAFIGIVALFYYLIASPQLLETALRALAAITVIAVLMNVYEFYNPGLLSTIGDRSAGLYGNPNASATAITMGLVLSIRIIPAFWRLPFLGFAGLGVFLTFSRSGIICFLAALVLMQLSSRLRFRRTAVLSLISIALAYSFASLAGTLRGEIQSLLPRDSGAFARITKLSLDRLTQDSRFSLIQQSWDALSSKPFLGLGAGTPHFDVGLRIPQGPHNLYLSLGIQFGIAGFLIFPILLMLLLKTPTPKPAPEVVVLVVVLVLNGFFTHGILIQWQYAVAIAIASHMGCDYRGTSASPTVQYRFIGCATSPYSSKIRPVLLLYRPVSNGGARS